MESPIRDLLATAGYRTPLALPLGKILGLAKLVDCVPTKELRSLDEYQLRLGDFRPGRWAWRSALPNSCASRCRPKASSASSISTSPS